METKTVNREVSPLVKALDTLCLNPLSVVGLLVLFVLPFVPPFNQEYLIRWLIAAAIMGASAIAFDFTAGFINIVNFGLYAFLGFGGYISALLAIHYGLTPWISMFCGGLFAAILGFLTGLLTLRLRGIFAAVMTWFIGLALMGLAIKLVWLTRGPLGLQVPRLFETASNVPYYYTVLVMMFIVYLVCKWVTRSNMGLAFKAIGQNMEAARTSGINPTYFRIVNFTLSCALVGWLGGFYGHYYGILTPDLMLTSKTVEVLAVAYIGGRGSLWGGAFIAFPFLFLMEFIRSSLSNLPGLNLVIYGVILMIIMIYYSGGVAALYYKVLGQPKSAFWRFMTGYRE